MNRKRVISVHHWPPGGTVLIARCWHHNDGAFHSSYTIKIRKYGVASLKPVEFPSGQNAVGVV